MGNTFEPHPSATDSIVNTCAYLEGFAAWGQSLEYNEFRGDLSAHPFLRVCSRLARARYNNFFVPQSSATPPEVAVQTWELNANVEHDVTANYWGATVTAEMNAAGNQANMSRIWDFWDDIEYARIDYSGWGQSAYPMVKITSPQYGTRFDSGAPITFSGRAEDTEDGILPVSSLEWRDDSGNFLGTGDTITVTNLAAGQEHWVWLYGTDWV